MHLLGAFSYDLWDALSVLGAVTLTLMPVFLGYWLNKRRGRHILVRETNVEPITEVCPDPQKDCTETDDVENAPTRLSKVHLEITNQALDTIDNITLTLAFPEGTEVVDVLLNPVTAPEAAAHLAPSTVSNEARITIPYLNSYKLHRDCLKATVTCDGSPMLRVAGSGNNWSVRHLRVREPHWKLWLGSALLESCFLVILALNVLVLLWPNRALTRTIRGGLLGLLAAAGLLLAIFLAFDVRDVLRQVRLSSRRRPRNRFGHDNNLFHHDLTGSPSSENLFAP